MTSEIFPYEGLIITTWSVIKSTDKSKIGSGEQPSVKQALGKEEKWNVWVHF